MLVVIINSIIMATAIILSITNMIGILWVSSRRSINITITTSRPS